MMVGVTGLCSRDHVDSECVYDGCVTGLCSRDHVDSECVYDGWCDRAM